MQILLCPDWHKMAGMRSSELGKSRIINVNVMPVSILRLLNLEKKQQKIRFAHEINVNREFASLICIQP